MRKIIILTGIMFLAFVINAQERSLSTKNLSSSQTYYKYTGVAADTLKPTTQDTIDIPIFLNKEWPVQFYLNLRFDPIAGGDTTVTVKLLGKVFANESWSSISTNVSGAISAANTDYAISSVSEPSQTILYDTTKVSVVPGFGYQAAVTQTAVASFYRYMLIRLILTGDDVSGTGTGVILDNLELKLWQRNF